MNTGQGTLAHGHRRWFRPPRPHGHVIEDRTVSFLELFYDLVFVVLVAQVAHTLAKHQTWTGLRDFVAVFGLIWLAWLNGSLYHELHGDEDGRSRTYIFVQMTIMAPLAVYAAHAADENADGRNFAIVYSLLLLLIAWQWFDVRRFDAPEWRPVAMRYVVAMLVITAVVFATAFLDSPETRVQIWLATVTLALVGNILFSLTNNVGDRAEAMIVTESMAERFGLFTIIMLGEVVVGVVDGLTESERNFRTVATALLALWLGFAYWWNYFDFAGRRIPRQGRERIVWLFAHFPLALCIAAAGAAMVSLIEHAGDGRTPAATAWMLAGTSAGITLSTALLVRTFNQRPGHAMVPRVMIIAAAGSLILGAIRPTPWLFALLLGVVVSLPWQESFARHARIGEPFIPED